MARHREARTVLNMRFCNPGMAAPRSLEESFVMLTGGAGGRHAPGISPAALAQQQAHQQGLDDLFAACARTFELASSSTQVDARTCVPPPSVALSAVR